MKFDKKISLKQGFQRFFYCLSVKDPGICKSLNIEGKTLTWDIDEDGDWAENTKGVDDYLFDLEKNKK